MVVWSKHDEPVELAHVANILDPSSHPNVWVVEKSASDLAALRLTAALGAVQTPAVYALRVAEGHASVQASAKGSQLRYFIGRLGALFRFTLS